jgi:L-amino acid N-acyltransferase YncA
MIVRKVSIEDAAQIAAIYNFYVLNTHHTFETDAVTVEEMRRRIKEISENYPYLAAEENNEIFGYACAAQYKSRRAYKHSAEVSVYVKKDLKQKGIGKTLYEKLLEAIRAQTDIRAVIAGIALPNDASVKLHENFGFEKVAHFREVGFKLDEWIDVGYWELINKK